MLLKKSIDAIGAVARTSEAMARSYVDASREAIAVLILHRGLIVRVYRNPDFPWIAVGIGQAAPSTSIASDAWLPGSMSQPEECDPETWLAERDCKRIELLLEQVLGQTSGYAMVLLHAELSEVADGKA